MNFQRLFTITMTAMMLAACSPLAAFKMSGESSNSSLGDGPAAAGGGSKVAGTGALSIPTGDALVARLTNSLGVNPAAGNFRTALAALKTNLPKVTDPTKATGFDSAQLLVYAACSDLTTGGANSRMTATYQVVAGQSVAQNQTKLIAAGVAMLDAYTAGLASQSSASAAVNASLTKLVSDISSVGTNTSTIAFMAVCIAANTTGSTMLGF